METIIFGTALIFTVVSIILFINQSGNAFIKAIKNKPTHTPIESYFCMIISVFCWIVLYHLTH